MNYYGNGEEILWQTNGGYWRQKWIHFRQDGGHEEGEYDGDFQFRDRIKESEKKYIYQNKEDGILLIG